MDWGTFFAIYFGSILLGAVIGHFRAGTAGYGVIWTVLLGPLGLLGALLMGPSPATPPQQPPE